MRSALLGERVEIPSQSWDGLNHYKLLGNWLKGKPGERQAAILFLHSLGGNKQEYNGLFLRMAAELCQHGYDCLRFDFTGCGESEGENEAYTPRQMLQDSSAALRFLKEQSPEKSLHLVGYSLGGLIALLSLEKCRSLVNSLTMLQAPFNLAQELKRRYPMGFDGVRTSIYMNAPIFKMSKEFKAELENGELIPSRALAAERLKNLPVLHIEGENDLIVPVARNSKDWKEFLESQQAITTNHLLPGADHGFSKDVDVSRVIDLVETFLKNLESPFEQPDAKR
ncbi:MAG: lysophospholipase [Candidatus Obscuribacterales bacterium]|nr:lysophospholipase [Candidatus Obscuribacterales bacterium]